MCIVAYVGRCGVVFVGVFVVAYVVSDVVHEVCMMWHEVVSYV